MNEASWLVQIFQMADEEAQASATQLLSLLPIRSVDARTCERGSFLIVECDSAAALSVHELVMMADPDAELIHTTAGPASKTSPV